MLAATVASISFIIGYDIFEEAEEGLLDYLLSLPISRRQFIVARAFGGAVRAMIYIIPMFIIIAVMLGFGDLFSIGMAVLSLFLLAFGVTGLSITMAVTVRSANRFDVTLALLDLALTRASTALYPIQKLPSYAVPLANISPVSFASGITRSLLLPGPGFDLYSLASLVAFVLVFLGLGAAFYFRRLEGGVYA
jgi:ABC-2 type transport system permease protein